MNKSIKLKFMGDYFICFLGDERKLFKVRKKFRGRKNVFNLEIDRIY